jgi:hypothetical protein
LFFTIRQVGSQCDDLLFEPCDAPFELVDVVGCA